jgi:hypothetical protein
MLDNFIGLQNCCVFFLCFQQFNFLCQLVKLILGAVQENEPVPDVGAYGQIRSGPVTGTGPVGSGPDGHGDAGLYPALPDAIAPSLATTPDFAKSGTVWCHASEVC